MSTTTSTETSTETSTSTSTVISYKNITVQTYYRILPTSDEIMTANYVIDNLDTNPDLKNPNFFPQKYEILGQVVTRLVPGILLTIESFIIFKQNDTIDPSSQLKHFIQLDFKKTMVNDNNKEITLFDYLQKYPYCSLSNDGFNYNIYNKKFYDEI